jgi:hypothetical protein
MMLSRPNSRPLAIIASSRLVRSDGMRYERFLTFERFQLIPLPWIIYLGMLFVATGVSYFSFLLGIGILTHLTQFAAAKPHLVSRSSVYYCQINSRTMYVPVFNVKGTEYLLIRLTALSLTMLLPLFSKSSHSSSPGGSASPCYMFAAAPLQRNLPAALPSIVHSRFARQSSAEYSSSR